MDKWQPSSALVKQFIKDLIFTINKYIEIVTPLHTQEITSNIRANWFVFIYLQTNIS